ncbi:hypothetical protein BHM03_00015082 [Ensete ventricosum]|nr:hypothetical protein BHM03_00015082 [Ensete ventricosum]
MHLLYGGRRSEGTKKGEGRGKERSDKWRGARGPTQRTLKPPPDGVGFPRKRSLAGLPLFSPSWSWTRHWMHAAKHILPMQATLCLASNAMDPVSFSWFSDHAESTVIFLPRCCFLALDMRYSMCL